MGTGPGERGALIQTPYPRPRTTLPDPVCVQGCQGQKKPVHPADEDEGRRGTEVKGQTGPCTWVKARDFVLSQ